MLMENNYEDKKIGFLAKDLRKIIISMIVLTIILIVLWVINQQTGLLAKIAEIFIKKLGG